MTAKRNCVSYEEALNLTGYSRYNALIFLLCSSIIIGMTFEIFSVSYLVPASSCELNTSSTQQGLVACVPLIGIIATSHFWGYLADTRGRRKILTISMTLSFVTGTAAAFSPNWIVFSVLKLLSSASVSGAFALCVTLLSECTPAAKRSSLVLLTTSVHLASMGVMAVVAIPILPLTFSFYIPQLKIFFNSWRVLDLIFAVPCAISAIGCACAYESPKYLVSVGREKEALKVLQGIYVINTGNSPDTYKVDSIDLNEINSSSIDKGFWGSVAAQTLPMLKAPLLKYTILLAALYVICYICMNAFFVWLPYIVNAFMLSVVNGERDFTICEMIRHTANYSAVEEESVAAQTLPMLKASLFKYTIVLLVAPYVVYYNGTNLFGRGTKYNSKEKMLIHDCSMNSQAMTLVFLITIILGVGNILMSVIVNCVGRKRLFIGIQMVAGVAALVINLSPYWILSAILFMVFLSGVFNFGFLNTFSVDVFPTYVKAMAVCLTLMVGRGSAVIGINVLKSLLDNNCEAAFYIFGAIALGGGMVGFLLPTDAKIDEQKNKLPA